MPAACLATSSSQSSVSLMASELVSTARASGARFGFITCTMGVDVEGLRQALATALPGVPFVGVTSCRAVIGGGTVVAGPRAAAALWLTGAEVKATVAGQSVVVADEAVGRQLARKVTQALGTTGSFALFHGTPGTEEALVRGVGQELKPGVALLGGSAADDEIAGKWSVFTHEARYVTGAVLALVSWPGKLAAPWISGATHTPQKGVVTRAQGRTILEIDNRAAAVVYDEWLGGALGSAMSSGEGILSKTTLSPLGVMRESGITLVHPERVVQPMRGLATFAEVARGETVTLVRSTKVGMQGRPANIVSRAMSEAGLSQLKGVLLIYCAGCMLAIDPDTQAMVKALQGVTGAAPLAGAFNFGEQGCHAGGKPEHGNLMTGALLLG